ncbi:MAG: hypothetical protein ACU0DT_05675 [Albimonas sp.]|uniref:hypothetical protein n=1 Tax=Albimonas sp. TaxID=1872425 RepID=UPI004056746D
MARIGIGSVVAICATLTAQAAWSFEAKWVRAGGGAPSLMESWEISPGMTMFFAAAIGVGTASICASLFAGR